jgi:hypothetical protein
LTLDLSCLSANGRKSTDTLATAMEAQRSSPYGSCAGIVATSAVASAPGNSVNRPSKAPEDVIAGITLAALGIPEVMGYTKIAGMPVITGLYTILIPILIYALLGSS